MLKQMAFKHLGRRIAQPPSGGCVLKQAILTAPLVNLNPAAFRRLCVETAKFDDNPVEELQPPSGGCVLKLII